MFVIGPTCECGVHARPRVVVGLFRRRADGRPRWSHWGGVGDYDGVAVLGGRADESGVRSAVADGRDEVGEEGDERRREQDRHSQHSVRLLVYTEQL